MKTVLTISIIMILVSFLLLTGAQAAIAAESDITGVWYLSGAEDRGRRTLLIDTELTIEFFSDNTFRVQPSSDDEMTGTWVKKNGWFYVVSDKFGLDNAYWIKDGYLVHAESGAIFSREEAEDGDKADSAAGIQVPPMLFDVSSITLPNLPFALDVETGAILYPGMRREEAEAITGPPVEEEKFGKNMFIYDNITLAYRDDVVVYIKIEYKNERWAVNGVISSDMPLELAFAALGIPYEVEEPRGIFDFSFYENGSCALHSRGDNDMLWLLSCCVDYTVGQMMISDLQYITTYQ